MENPPALHVVRPGSEEPGPAPSGRPRPMLVVATFVTLVVAVADPRAFAVALVIAGSVGLLAVMVVARSAWRTWRRPIGSLSVGDAILGAMIVRWWQRRGTRRSTWP